MKIYDISMAVGAGMPVYNDLPEKKPVITVTRDRSVGEVFESRIAMDMHTGTHIDAPLHMLPDGSTMDGMDPARLIAPCSVLDLGHVAGGITAADLEAKSIREGKFVLLKTRNSETDEFEKDFVYLAASGAEYLRQIRVAGVGTDALGIERSQPGHDTHKILFRSGIIIIEGLRLKGVPEGEYTLAALPLKIEGAEAAPARAILIEE
jgi:arylformamidase